MRKILFLTIFAFCFNAYAQEAKEVPLNKAIINVINKKKGQFKDVEINVGGESSYEEAVLKVSACVKKNKGLSNDFWAYVNFKNQANLFDDEKKEGADVNLWVSSLSPSLSSIDDETYDIKLIRCE